MTRHEPTGPKKQHSTTLLLVDFENVPRLQLPLLDERYRVVIFVGTNQKNIPFELVTATQQLGPRVEWQKVSGEGRNALDFFIAWYLGRMYERHPRPECLIVSMDKGFDPLLRHLNAAGMVCRRITGFNELRPVSSPRADQPPAAAPTVPVASAVSEERLRRVLEVLGRSPRRSRPRKRRTLAQAVSAMFQRKLARHEIDQIIDALLARRLITETNGVFSYEF